MFCGYTEQISKGQVKIIIKKKFYEIATLIIADEYFSSLSVTLSELMTEIGLCENMIQYQFLSNSI